MGIVGEASSRRSPSPQSTISVGLSNMAMAEPVKDDKPAVEEPSAAATKPTNTNLLQLCEQALLSLGSSSAPDTKKLARATPESSSSLVPCKWKDCSSSFETPELLGAHIGEHHIKPQKVLNRKEKKRGFQCEWSDCVRDKPFNSCYNLEHHIRYKHTGEKPFPCTVPNCSSRFAQASDLKEHLRLHDQGTDQKKKKRRGSDDENSSEHDDRVTLPPITRFLLPPLRTPAFRDHDHSHDPSSPLFINVRPGMFKSSLEQVHTHSLPGGGSYIHSHPIDGSRVPGQPSEQPSSLFIGVPHPHMVDPQMAMTMTVVPPQARSSSIPQSFLSHVPPSAPSGLRHSPPHSHSHSFQLPPPSAPLSPKQNVFRLSADQPWPVQFKLAQS